MSFDINKNLNFTCIDISCVILHVSFYMCHFTCVNSHIYISFAHPSPSLMLPIDPELVSGLPSEEKSIFMGTAVGLSTVILGTSLLRISPLNSTGFVF
jgi:hypothetical protein